MTLILPKTATGSEAGAVSWQVILLFRSRYEFGGIDVVWKLVRHPQAHGIVPSSLKRTRPPQSGRSEGEQVRLKLSQMQVYAPGILEGAHVHFTACQSLSSLEEAICNAVRINGSVGFNESSSSSNSNRSSSCSSSSNSYNQNLRVLPTLNQMQAH